MPSIKLSTEDQPHNTWQSGSCEPRGDPEYRRLAHVLVQSSHALEGRQGVVRAKLSAENQCPRRENEASFFHRGLAICVACEAVAARTQISWPVAGDGRQDSTWRLAGVYR